jgi:Tol biopolymer transport system component
MYADARLYLVSAQGGEPELLVEDAEPNTLTWSPDGTRIVFDNTSQNRIEILDLRTKKTETIPGSEGLRYPQWSPDGRYLVAVGGAQDELRLYDFETGEWRTLYEAGARYPEWSRRGEPYVYFRQKESRRIFRISITDQELEKVADLDLEMAGGWWDTGWAGLAPDDSILVLKRVSIQQIYAFDFEAP